MSKQPTPPPPGDRPTPTAPPPPPAWRHWLWPIAIGLVLVAWIFLPAIHTRGQVTPDLFAVPVRCERAQGQDGHDRLEQHEQRRGHRHPHQRQRLHHRDPGPAGRPHPDQQAAGRRGPDHRGRAELVVRLGAGVLADPACDLRVAATPVAAAVARRSGRRRGAGGRAQRGQVAGEGVRRRAADDHVRDVAGYEGAKAEISEVVDFLRNPERYRRAGRDGAARRADDRAAGHRQDAAGPRRGRARRRCRSSRSPARASWRCSSASGAARVRDLFAEARKRAPAIIFIDEIDAIGQRRGGAGAVSPTTSASRRSTSCSRRWTGSTRRRASWSWARPTGRRSWTRRCCGLAGSTGRSRIPLPNLAERAAILAVHCRDKQLGPDVDLQVVARGTPGFSGADLANLANEAAINAVRGGREVLTAAGLRRGQGPHPARPPRRLQRAAARGEARRRGPRVRSRAGRRPLRARRPGGKGHDPARRAGARGDRAAAAGRAPPLR